jgi:formiminotetrahydrofolate cyclodeaminase
MEFRKSTIEEFLRVLGSSSPTPGGGTVAALSGALAAGLTKMVASLTKGKKGYESCEAVMMDILSSMDSEIEWFENMMDADAEAFDSVSAAMKLPKNSPEQKEERTRSMQEALKKACEAPLATARRIVAIAPKARLAAEKGNKNARSDALCALQLCRAGFRMAVENILINLEMIKDDEYVQRIKEMTESMEACLKPLIEE